MVRTIPKTMLAATVTGSILSSRTPRGSLITWPVREIREKRLVGSLPAVAFSLASRPAQIRVSLVRPAPCSL
jgi:hypothetical protein